MKATLVQCIVLSLLICGYALQPAHAQGVFLLPARAEAVEGDSRSAYPFTYVGDFFTSRSQQFMAQSVFPAAVSQGIWLNGVSFRRDIAPGPTGGAGTANFPSIQLVLSTTKKPFSELSDRLDDNTGQDQELVFSGSKSFVLPAPPRIGPATFNVTIEFQRPFFYTPSKGTLVLDVKAAVATPSDSIPLDFVSDGSASEMYFFFDQGPQFGVSSVSGGLPIQFTYSVPEPAPVSLLAVGAILLGANRFNRFSRNAS